MAAASGFGTAEKKVMRVWDLETGDVRVFDLEPPGPDAAEPPGTTSGYEHGVRALAFTDESTLLTAGADGVRRWDLATGSFEAVVATEPGSRSFLYLSLDRERMLIGTRPLDPPSSRPAVVVHDLRSGASQDVHLDPECDFTNLAIDPAGEILAESCADGAVRVGRIDQGAYHLLLGHDGPVVRVAVSPDGAWVASAGEDKTLRLWPMPDLDKPPLHTLPHEELIAKLHSLTNLRVVRDADSATGWKVEVGPFPGWETVPKW